MRAILGISLCIVLWLISTACRLPTANALPHVDSATSTPTTLPVFLPLISGINTLKINTPTASQPSIAPSTVVTAWLTYTDTRGVAFEYPADWSKVISHDAIYFHSPSELTNTVGVEIYERPLADQKVTDPYNSTPNEGGYNVYWATPLTAEHADGLLFVWASYGSSMPIAFAQAIYYSKPYELDVRFNSDFDDESASLAKNIGLAPTLVERYPVFNHMVRSVRFFAPLAAGK